MKPREKMPPRQSSTGKNVPQDNMPPVQYAEGNNVSGGSLIEIEEYKKTAEGPHLSEDVMTLLFYIQGLKGIKIYYQSTISR